ncbi:MAG: phenylalanine--tRNA ligase subunit beta [Bacilli bacterium]|nr:phenylalanine--tRNA ligase subunit beta [Bacilli bacterium]
MLVSLKALRQYVSLDGLNEEEIAKGLTFAGVEVEDIERMASGTNLVIGEILECENHPDSDHLHVLKVNLGDKYGVEQIVCGAPNARKGLKVIVARVGAKLPQVEIKKGVIRGVESNGMCCSLLELGVDSKYLSEKQTSGIEELPLDAPVGEEDVLGYLGLDDIVLNLNVLANRPDLLSLFNVAREVGAIFSREVKLPSFEGIENFKTDLTVGSKTKRCTQFAGKEIKGLVIKESPDWMKSFLQSMGVRSINNLVDIGNYVMLMTGQPLHMYDADKLPVHALEARDDYQGPFVALDEKTYDVLPNDIVIASDNKPMCLGGVMGSLACAVDEKTTHLYIESASFDGASIRRTSNRLGLASESSSRFVKGTNHFQSEYVINMASKLVKDLCEGKEFSNIVNYQIEKAEQKVISSSVKRINNRLGTSFSKEEIEAVLTRLNFKVEMNKDETFKVTVPLYRLDVTCDADLSEEVIRLLGLEHVKSELPCLDTTLGALSLEQTRIRNIRNYLLDKGLDECLTYSLVSEKEASKMNLLNEEEKYVLLNPLTDEHSTFRSHVLHSLLKVANYNVSRQAKSLALFEVSNVQTKQSASTHLAIVLLGNDYSRGLMEKIPYDFYHMKGIVEGMMENLGLEVSRYKFERLNNHLDELHPGKSAGLYFQNKLIGVLGELHPNKINEYDLGKNPVIVLELRLDELVSSKVSVNKMKPIHRFPFVTRDLAFIIDKDVEAKDIIKAIRLVGKGIVTNAEVFDVYEGEHVQEGKKSLAISLTYQKEDATLTEKEVSDAEDKIKFELLKTFHAELRM